MQEQEMVKMKETELLEGLEVKKTREVTYCPWLPLPIWSSI
jgi:hypothetical protein